MKSDIGPKLEWFRSDYLDKRGVPFSHFFCPVLFEDAKVPLCKSHIVNQAFPGSSGAWTIQRQDVDNFYGSRFEADFTTIQHNEDLDLGKTITDQRLSQAFRPKILVDDKPVEYFVARDRIPENFSQAVIEGEGDDLRIGIKLSPEEMLAAIGKKWQIVVEKDIRVAALVSLIKAAHLTLFEMLGYRYVFSPAGHLVGRQILGEFFIQNRDKPKKDVQKNAYEFFREFVHMIRPVESSLLNLQGTVVDKQLLICKEDGGLAWAMIVFLKISESLHAVLMPALDHPFAAARFLTFLRDETDSIRAALGRFESDRWSISTNSTKLYWPKTGELYL